MSASQIVNRLKVGDTVLEARAERASWIAWPRRADPFRVFKGADIRITVRREPGPRPGRLLFDSGGVWKAHEQADGRLLFTFRVGRAIYKSVLIDRGITQGDVYFPRLRGGGPRSALQFPLDEMLFQQRWAREGQLEVHACGVKDGKKVLLFAGHSGAGKSTTAKLWHESEPQSLILSDDRVLLDPRDRTSVRAFGTPWHGTGRFGLPAEAPLAALFFLEQAKTSEAVRLRPAEAAARLFTRTFPPIWDREATQRVIDACGAVAERIPAFLLRFRRDRSAIDAARRASAG